MKGTCTSFLRIHRSPGSAGHTEEAQQILGECITHVFLLSVSGALGLPDSGGTASPRDRQSLETANNLPRSVPFIYKPSNLKPTPHSSFTGLLALPGLSPTDLRASTRRGGTVLIPQSPRNYSNQPILSLLTLSCFALPSRTIIKTLVHTVFLTPSASGPALMLMHVAQCDTLYLFLLGNYEKQVIFSVTSLAIQWL